MLYAHHSVSFQTPIPPLTRRMLPAMQGYNIFLNVSSPGSLHFRQLLFSYRKLNYLSMYKILFQYTQTCQFHIYTAFFFFAVGPTRARAYSFFRFLDHTHWRTTLSRTSLDNWSARHRDLCQYTTHIQAPVGIRTHNFRRRAAEDLCLQPAATVTGNI